MHNFNWHPRWVFALALSSAVSTNHCVAAGPVDLKTTAIQPAVVAAQEDQAAKDQAVDTVSNHSLPDQATPPGAANESRPAVPCSCCNSTCCTKKKKEAATTKMKGAFKTLFYDNDFSYLNDPCYDGPSFCGDGLKGLCCNKLDIGGEIRVRFHNEDNIRGVVPPPTGPSLGLTGNDDNFWLTRYRMYANYQMNEHFRFYGEYLYADSGGEVFNNRPIEENRGELQNLFGDVKLTESLTLRVGRQELLYGAQRLVSPLDWANTRRTFDGAKFICQGDDWRVDGFFTHPVARTFANESKIDDTVEQVDFYGLWATRGGVPIGNVDAYYLGLNNSIQDFDFQTLGTRVWGKSDDGLLYEFEGGIQFGENSPGYGDHFAGFVTGGLGRQLDLCVCGEEWKPTFWFWYDWASGGDEFPGARGDDGFDQLFPLAHKYLGFMDLFGRRNINDVNMQFITPVFGSNVKLLLWYHYFFLDQATTPYDVANVPFNSVAAAGDKELGHELDVLFTINMNPRNSVLLGYSFFSAGDYYDTTPGVPTNADAQFFYAQFQQRF